MGRYAVVLLIYFSLSLSCSQESAVNIEKFKDKQLQDSRTLTHQINVEVVIYPSKPTKGSTINAIVREKKGNLKYQWLVNDEPVLLSSDPYFDTRDLKKGDSIRVVVIEGDSKISSDSIFIVNSPPVIKNAYLFPKIPLATSDFRVDVDGIDIDGDQIRYEFEWFINDKKVENYNSEKFNYKGLKRGNEVSVKVTPFDGTDKGSPVIRSVKLMNSSPIFKTDNIEYIYNPSNRLLTSHLKATDPDGDSLTYSLTSGPSGMTINPITGLIQWTVPPDFKGKTPVTVSVSDGHGGEALYNFEVTIGFEGR